jgi:hypothetical protein
MIRERMRWSSRVLKAHASAIAIPRAPDAL